MTDRVLALGLQIKALDKKGWFARGEKAAQLIAAARILHLEYSRTDPNSLRGIRFKIKDALVSLRGDTDETSQSWATRLSTIERRLARGRLETKDVVSLRSAIHWAASREARMLAWWNATETVNLRVAVGFADANEAPWDGSFDDVLELLRSALAGATSLSVVR